MVKDVSTRKKIIDFDALISYLIGAISLAWKRSVTC